MVEFKDAGIEGYCVLSSVDQSMKDRIIDLYESSLQSSKNISKNIINE